MEATEDGGWRHPNPSPYNPKPPSAAGVAGMQLSTDRPIDWVFWTSGAARRDRALQNSRWLLPIVKAVPDRVPSIYSIATMLVGLDQGLQHKLLAAFPEVLKRQDGARRNCGGVGGGGIGERVEEEEEGDGGIGEGVEEG